MSKTAFMFAGQGAQKIGMGKELAENFSSAMRVFDNACDALGFDIKSMIWDGDEQTLMITENTQPCVVTMSAAALAVLEEKGIKPDMTAGLSLGEYTAHIAAGSLKFDDAVRLVKKRGRFMQEAVPVGVGAMAAVIGLSNEEVENCCRAAADAGYVSPANYNCPGQLVISGETAAVERACELCREKGAKRAKPLPVSAPFHCEMLGKAAEKLAAELENIDVSDMSVPVYTNSTALPIESKEDIKPSLVRQVTSSVRWEQTVRNMIDRGADTFIEIGPGRALGGFVGRISKDVKVYNVEDMKSLNNLLEALGKC